MAAASLAVLSSTFNGKTEWNLVTQASIPEHELYVC